MKAKAVVFKDKLQVEVQEIEVPELGRDQVWVDVEYSWISIGTEASFLRKERTSGEVIYQDGDPSPFPQVAGYQKVGVVRAIGADIKGISVGERVFATISEVNNMAVSYGGHVSPAVTHESQIWKLPDSEASQAIAYSGLVLAQVGYNCGFRAPVKPGDNAVVIGDGLVGQWAAQSLLQRGAKVAVLGRHDERLALLPEAIRGFNMRKTSLEEALREYAGIQIVVDTVGTMDTVLEIIPTMNHDSHLVSAGFHGSEGMVNIQTLRAKEITLHCPSGWEKTRMDATIEGIRAGWLQTESLITHILPVDQAKEAWDLILDKKQFCLGVVLKWK